MSDDFGLPEELQRDPDLPPRRNLLPRVLLALAVIATLIIWI